MEMQNFEINREKLDFKAKARFKFRAKPGLTEELVRKISSYKNEPEWMLKKRLEGLEYFKKAPLPTWGPDLSKLNFDEITYFGVPEGNENAKSWDEVPEEIKKTFDKLGIPQVEREFLGGLGAQFESVTAYHNIKKELEAKGVIFENMDVALKEYPELIRKYFMTKCVPVRDHKFAALHAAVWSSGTFIYIPEGLKVDLPLQAYFRMNAEGMGQFEHTLIIADKNAEVHYLESCSAPRYSSNSIHAGCVEIHALEGARVRYSSIENWSKNTYNLNTKRALVYRNARVDWTNGNMGSGCTMLYPCSMLLEEGASSDSIGIAYAGEGQNQDTGSKVYHLASNTSSTIQAKSISKDGGITTYRGLLKVKKGAKNVKSNVKCDALMLDDRSRSDTVPYIEIKEKNVDIGHEATAGKVSDEQLFYLMSRGLSAEEAMKMIVCGFIEPVSKQLPGESAVELNRLIELEMEGSVG